MSNSLSVAPLSGVTAGTKPEDYARKPGSSDSASLNSDANLIHTAKQLKQAEMKGINIPVGEELLIKAIERANKALQGVNTSFQFSIHAKTREIMVKVLDNETGEVIREIPPEKTLDMIAKMWEFAGLLVDKKV